MKLCSIENCNDNTYCKGLCHSHYHKQWRSAHKKDSSQYNKLYKQANKEYVAAYDKKYSETDQGRFTKAKTKAKQRGLEFDLYFENFVDISNRPCFYCADALCGKEKFQGAHLDRIDNSIGYLLDNVISCGALCNKIRMNNLSVAETKDAVEAILAGRKRRQKKWFVYIVLCTKDNTFYTGITTDIKKRITQHNDGTGAKYTRGRGPITLLKSFEVETKSEALKLEYKIKQLPKDEKLNYVQEK